MTNAVFSPRLERNIGYAWVPIERARAGTKLEIESPVRTVPAHVVPLPFYDPSKKIQRS